MKNYTPLFIALSAAILSACAPYKPDSHKAGVCNELNSQIIFSGNTSNTRKAEIENAESHLSQKNYDKHCT